MDPFEKILTEVRYNLIDYSEETLWNNASKVFRMVRKTIKGSTDDFFSLMASRFTNLETAPPGFSRWLEISNKWAYYKRYARAGFPKKKSAARKEVFMLNRTSRAPNEFYYGIGEFGRQKNKKARGPGNIHFRDILAKMTIGKGRLGEPSVELRPLDDSGLLWTQGKDNTLPRPRDPNTGRFAKTKGLSFEVEINAYLFPEAIGKTPGQVLDQMKFENPYVARIFELNEYRRPLFRPYLLWYMEQKTTEISNKIGNKL